MWDVQEEIEKSITYSGRLNVVDILYPRQILLIQFLSHQFFVKLINNYFRLRDI